MFSISKSPLESKQLCDALSNSRAGALATFEGWVRNHNEGNSVTSLEYECFEALALKEGAKIIAEARERFDILDASCSHRVGVLPVGEMAVWVGVTSVHRADAFDACRFVIDEIKLRLPIWKKEHYTNGTSDWVNCSAHEHQRQHETHTDKRKHKHEHSHMDKESDAAHQQFSDAEYYSRQLLVKEVGAAGQKKLKNARVLVVGAGGTGCPALQYLAGAGVGEIGICDFDVVDISNLHRQPLYDVKDVGKRKAEVAAHRLRAANPFINVSSITEKFQPSNAPHLVANYDLILDCTDNLSAKFSIADACRQHAKTMLQASVHGFDGQLLMWRAVQNSGGKNHEGQCYRCLWPSKEQLQPGGKDCIESCAETGVLGAVPGLMGTMLAIEAMKIMLDLPTPLSESMILVDLLSCTTSKIKVRRDEHCASCNGEVTADRADRDSKLGAPQSAQNDDEDGDAPEDNDFELHWNVLRSRSPRELVYVDIRSKKEREADETTASKLKGRPLHTWPLDEIDAAKLELERNLIYLFICQRGKRSGTLVHQLRKLGHKNVFSLAGGVESMAAASSQHAKV